MKSPYQVKEKNNDSTANISNNKSINKRVTKFKSNPKIENRSNLNINLTEKGNSTFNLVKSSSAAKIRNSNFGSKIKGNTNLEKVNFDKSKSFYKNNDNGKNKNNQSKLAYENEENNNYYNLIASQNLKVNNFASKHKKTYSDFSSPSPIIKTKPKAITTNNLKNNYRNSLNSNSNRAYNDTSKVKNNNSNNFNNKNYLGDRKNINSEKTMSKGKLKIFESNNFSNQNNLDSYKPNSQINYSNLNSKEENQIINRKDESRVSYNFDNNIVNKNIINYDFTFKNIPIFDNIDEKQKFVKQNSLKNPEINHSLSYLSNTMKNNVYNQDSNINSEVLVLSPKKVIIDSINKKENMKNNQNMQSNSDTIENNKNFSNTINIHERVSAPAYSNLKRNSLDINFLNLKMLNEFNKLEIPDMDNYINSSSAIMNKENSINLLNSNRKDNLEVQNEKNNQEIGSNNIQINNNKIKENSNGVIASDLPKNKSYKIIDTVHLNKFLNNRSNNFNINSMTNKPKTTTITNFVSISNQENMKFNLNKNETIEQNEPNESTSFQPNKPNESKN